ncbi:hypothetical protein LCGC14_2162690 [marine sediment metagenome]|uniref:Uncharacterized protein n=1 Tax=marine sediment metagenome TaxID=412755 RepID=A0A0F9EEI3_9ZZZZ
MKQRLVLARKIAEGTASDSEIAEAKQFPVIMQQVDHFKREKETAKKKSQKRSTDVRH